jgi:hypothetical protein
MAVAFMALRQGEEEEAAEDSRECAQPESHD